MYYIYNRAAQRSQDIGCRPDLRIRSFTFYGGNMLKKPTTIDEQIEILRKHGILISDPNTAKTLLSQIGYYRLSGYALQYRKSPSDSDCINGTTFEDIYNSYLFDEELRSVLRTYLEIVEVYYKTQIGYWFALKKCALPPHDQHYDRNNYYNKNGFDSIMASFKNRSVNYYHDSLIVQHHQAKYNGKMPLWVLLELFSFSNASMLYSAMYISEQDTVASAVGVSRQTLLNHLHCLAVLRNKCAHGARLYDTVLRPTVSFNATFLRKHPEISSCDTLFAYILMLLRRLPSCEQKKRLYNDIISLIQRYVGKIDLQLIGFPSNYETILGNSVI